MKRQHADHEAGRRSFLRGMAAAGGATALGAVFASRLMAEGNTGTAARKGTQSSTSRGYHETEHIRNYYRTLRM